jgi:hypothetical protein
MKITVFEYRPSNEMFRGIHEAQAEFNGQTFVARSRNGIEMKLARMLVEAGAPDQPWETYGIDGRKRLSGSSLHRLAKLDVQQSGSIGTPRIVRYRPKADALSRKGRDQTTDSDSDLAVELFEESDLDHAVSVSGDSSNE